MLRTLLTLAVLMGAVFGLAPTPTAAQNAQIACPSVRSKFGLTLGPSPLGDFIGFIVIGGKRVQAEPVDVLGVTSRANNEFLGWLYIDQFGNRWMQLIAIPPNATAADVGGASLKPAGMLKHALSGTASVNPDVVTIHRCSSIG